MKKRVIAFVMCLVLVFSMLPAACLDSVAAAETEVEVEPVSYTHLYGAATGVNTADPANHFPKTAVQKLIIDGGLAEEMVLQNTVNWSMEDMYSTYIYLTAGNHKITVEGSDSEGKAVVDCIYLTYKGKTSYDTAFDKTYEAELGEFNEIKGETTKPVSYTHLDVYKRQVKLCVPSWKSTA